MRALIAALLLALVLPIAPAVAQVEPLVIEGSGIQSSAPFVLDGGDYYIQWTATPKGDGGCYHGGTLEMAGNPLGFVMLANEILPDSTPVDGETYAYGLKPGRYYLKMSSGCDWRVTLTRLL